MNEALPNSGINPNHPLYLKQPPEEGEWRAEVLRPEQLTQKAVSWYGGLSSEARLGLVSSIISESGMMLENPDTLSVATPDWSGNRMSRKGFEPAVAEVAEPTAETPVAGTEKMFVPSVLTHKVAPGDSLIKILGEILQEN